MTTTQTQSATQLPQLVEGELPLAVPPISPERALQAAAANAKKDAEPTGINNNNGNEFNGTGLSEIINPYTNLDHLKTLEQGGCLFSFRCTHELKHYEAEMVDSVINLSAFDDEVKENYVPYFDCAAKEQQEYKDSVEEEAAVDEKKEEKPAVAFNPNSLFGFDLLPAAAPIQETVEPEEPPYSFLLARTAYLLTGVDIQGLLGPDGASILSGIDYQEACQPSGTTVWTDTENMEPHNFRITKPVIPYVYDLVVQFRVSSLSDDKEVLASLGRHVGTRVDGGILLERTKRSNPPKEDATKKAKSVLLYTDLGQGVSLVTHLTVVLQRGLPDPVERLINYLPNRFQAWGLGETCETADKTNRYLRELLPVVIKEDEEEDEFLDAKSSLEEA